MGLVPCASRRAGFLRENSLSGAMPTWHTVFRWFPCGLRGVKVKTQRDV